MVAGLVASHYFWKNDRGLDYVKYNLPVLGSNLRGKESAKYVSDVERNTGRTVRYPGLIYNNGAQRSVNEAVGLAGGIGKTFRYL